MTRYASDLGCLALEELSNPVTYRWHLQGEWGASQQTATFDIPAAAGDDETIMKLGGLLWRLSIAGATTVGTQMQYWEYVTWRSGPMVQLSRVAGGGGVIAGPASSRSNSAVLVCSTGKFDSFGSRRIFLPGIPHWWVEDRLLTPTGRRSVENLGQLMVMGMSHHLTGAPYELLNMYVDAIEPTVANPRGVVFRRVEFVVVTHHTDRAPDPGGSQWP